MSDPFDTAGIRRRVLDAWSASPARFREDANAEEDLALGTYRDRLLVELAQNAADAALRAGVPGSLRLHLVDGELRAANTGAPLDAEGVASLATLRASAKRPGPPDAGPVRAAGTVGRFGVGFAAVLSVSDEPLVLSRSGGVRFSARDARAEVDRVPALAAERDRRGGAVPVLRLPWPAEGAPPDGFATEVRLPLRPGTAEAVARALGELRADLLLGLPGLVRIEVDGRVLSRRDENAHVLLRDGEETRRWRMVTTVGRLPADLLADRPTEERERDRWSLTWAVPVDEQGRPVPLPAGQVVHAPTPSDEPLSLPVRLLGTFPLDPGRRHVAPGPLTDHLVEQAAAGYAELVCGLPATPDLLPLVPRVGLAAAALDAALCRAVLAALRRARWLPGQAVEGQAAVPMAPPDTALLDSGGPELVGALRDVVVGLLPAGWSGRAATVALDAVGTRRLSTRDVVDLVSSLRRPPVWWRSLYEGLSRVPDRDALGALPVPLADGRLVTGPRGLLLSEVDLPADAVAALGLRLVHPQAAHPLLERLGATRATPRAMLADERVRAAVGASLDAEDPGPVAEAVLALVRAAEVAPGELDWLAELALPGQDGEWYPAGELLLPDGPLAGVVGPDAPFGLADTGLVERWGDRVLEAVGVLRTFAVLRVPDAVIGPVEHDLDGEQDYQDTLLDRLPDVPEPTGFPPPARLVELVAVRDLELVAADRWPAALDLLATGCRVALDAPAVAVLPDGGQVRVPAYTRWWLARHPVLDGRRPDRLRLTGTDELAGLYDLADPTGTADTDLLAAVGCLTGLPAVLADPELAANLLARLGDPARTVPAGVLTDIYARLAAALDGWDPEPPDRVRIAPDQTCAASDTVVLDKPYLLPLLAGRSVVPAGGRPGPVADLLDVDLASEVATGAVLTRPVRTVPWAEVPGVQLAAARCAAPVPTGLVGWHQELRVRPGRGAPAVAVPWWPDRDTDHVDTGVGGAALGRALAWRLGCWHRRAAVAEALTADAAARDGLRAEDAAE